MIICDGIALNLNTPKSPVEKAVAKAIQEIKNTDKILILKDPTPIRFSDTKRPHFNSRIAFRLNTGEVKEWKGEFGSFSAQWMQCDSPAKFNKEMQVYEYEASRMEVMGELSLHYGKAPEKVFFFLNLFEPGMVGLKIEDKELEASKRNVTRRLRSTVEYLITSEEKLGTNDKRKLAYSWGIDAGEMSVDILQEELFNKVELSEKNKEATGRGFAEFIEDANKMGKDVQVRAYIQQALERKLIHANQIKGWFYSNGHQICPIPIEKWNRRVDILLSHFIVDKASFDLFKASLRDIIPDEAPLEISIDGIPKEILIKIARSKYDKIFPVMTNDETLQEFFSDKKVLSSWLEE